MRAWLIATLLIVALAGCADPSTDEDPNDTDPTGDPTGTPSDGPDGTDGVGDNTTLLAVLAASAANGTAPLEVAFNISAQGASANATWVLDFGNGNATNGTSLPAMANHTFAAGNFTVTLTVADAQATANATVSLVVAPADAPEPPAAPTTTHWEFGPTAGCIEDLGSTCLAYDEGPGGEGPDGHWIQLGEAYWGLGLTSTVDKGDAPGTGEWPMYDTDCFFTDAAGTVVGDGHGGGGPCTTDAIPLGAEWLFLFPYLTPAIELTVDVVV